MLHESKILAISHAFRNGISGSSEDGVITVRRSGSLLVRGAILAAVMLATLWPASATMPRSGVELCVLCGDFGLADAIVNVVLFVPLGLAFARPGRSWWASLASLAERLDVPDRFGRVHRFRAVPHGCRVDRPCAAAGGVLAAPLTRLPGRPHAGRFGRGHRTGGGLDRAAGPSYSRRLRGRDPYGLDTVPDRTANPSALGSR